MKEHIEFFLSTESNKFVYKGLCKVYLNTESKLLLIEPENEDIKILKIPFCNSFVQHKNLLIYYSSNDSSENGVLSFSTEKDCKEIYLDRLKHQVTVKQEVIADDELCTPSSNKKFIDDILYALDNGVKNNSNVPEHLKRDIAQMLNQPSQKEVAKNGFSSDIEVQTNQNSPKTIQSPVDEIISRKRKHSSSVDYKKEKQCKMEITELDDVSSEVPTFELSFDDHYSPTTSQSTFTFPTNFCIQHSIPAQNLDRAFFPTWMNSTELRRFHRKPLSKSLLQSLSTGKDGFVDILSAGKHIKEFNVKSEHSIPEYENYCPYRDVSALSAKNGKLLFFEYSEEYPPLLNQPGMACKIRNYYKKVDGEDSDFQLDFGETCFTQNFPYLGELKSGQHLQSLENNMFCAPVFQHKFQSTDYLLIFSGNKTIIRKCSNLFVVGQECPLQEVPNPNSKKAKKFSRDFLLVFIFRLFWASTDIPRRLKMEDIRKAFPHLPESSVRKRLKMCAEFIRVGDGLNTNYWVLKENFRLPTEEEILKLITPEMWCAYYSMMSSKQRLTDAGYGETNILANIDESGSDDDDVKIEDEIQCAPWNTTKAFLTTLEGKCYLDRSGTADPTGCGEAFSYIRKPSKWTRKEENFLPKKAHLCTGTNADLRKLPIKEARELCKEYGFPEETINTLGRWKVIDLIRKISIQEAKDGADLNGIARFARSGIRLAQKQRNWKEYCQKIFDLQNQSLSNDADVPSDDENLLSEDEEVSIIESENDESNGSFASTVTVKREHNSCFGPAEIFGPVESGSFTVSRKFERKNFKTEDGKEKYFDESVVKEESCQSSDSHQSSDNCPSTSASSRLPESLLNFATINNDDELVYGENCKVSRKSLELLFEQKNNDKTKKLKIVRTFRDSNGHDEIRSEVISNSKIIDAYIKIRTTKDIQFIKEYSYNDEGFKKENRRKIRQLQDRLRRIKRREESGILLTSRGAPSKKKKPQKEFTMKCSSCGAVGHMKTNKNCPFYKQSGYHQPKPTIGQLNKYETDELTQVEETKVRIKKSALSLKSRISKNVLKQSKKDGK